MKALSIVFNSFVLAGATLGCGAVAAQGPGVGDSQTASGSAPVHIDFLDAAYLPGFERVVVSGLHGMVGMLEVGEREARLTLANDRPDEDFTAMARFGDGTVLLGSSSGRLYRYDGESFTEIAALSEYDEPILDIAVMDDGGVWAVGARGLLARSSDGETFENIEISGIVTPPTPFPGGQPADWYLGVSNLDPESIEFTATVDGEPAVEDEDYILFPDEGFVQVQNQLDMEPPPTIAFRFSPGPPFRAGDVSWNVVLASNGLVTIAGEFGMILQSEDNGETWVRRDVEIVPQEPEPAYWLAGVQEGELIWLTGAAGANQRSEDGGETWIDNPPPGREGIFGVTLHRGLPVIAGAVGLIGTLQDDTWKLADRTRLKLLSWMKTPVELPDGTLLITGGRATAIRYVDGDYVRIPVVME